MSNESSSEKAQVPLLPETYHVLILQAGRIYTERMIACELRFGCLTIVQVEVKNFLSTSGIQSNVNVSSDHA